MPTGDEEFRRIVGAHIRHARKQRGISGVSLARQLGMATSNLNYIEAGRYRLRLDTWLAICHILKINPFHMLSNIIKASNDVSRGTLTPTDKETDAHQRTPPQG